MEDNISSEINNYLIQVKDDEGTTFKDSIFSTLQFDVPARLHDEHNLQALISKDYKSDKDTIIFDEDGDILVNRASDQKRNETARLFIEHKNSTDLKNVGRQLWRGALYLADYLLELCDKNVINEDQYINKGAWLEIGAGTGLLAVISFIVKPKQMSTSNFLYITDLSDILPLTQSNIGKNLKETQGLIKIVPLNLKDEKLPNELFDKEISLVLAADIIYEDELTDGIIQTLYTLILQQHQLKCLHKTRRNILSCLFSIEKRVNFTIRNMNICAPAYDYFSEKLRELDHKLKESNIKLNFEYITLDDSTQWLCYERCKGVIIIKIDASILH